MTLYSELDFTDTWDGCNPAALLARAIVRANRDPSPLELEALNCAGFAGTEGKEIDAEAAQKCITVYLSTKKGKLSGEKLDF